MRILLLHHRHASFEQDIDLRITKHSFSFSSRHSNSEDKILSSPLILKTLSTIAGALCRILDSLADGRPI